MRRGLLVVLLVACGEDPGPSCKPALQCVPCEWVFHSSAPRTDQLACERACEVTREDCSRSSEPRSCEPAACDPP
jgi:hypothetical protein